MPIPPTPGAGGSFGVAPVVTLAPAGSRPFMLELGPFWALGPGGLGLADVGVASGFVAGPGPDVG